MDAKPILQQWLEDDDYLAFGRALANAYEACDLLVRSSPTFDNFEPGREHRSHLLGIFVQHELAKLPSINPAFSTSVELNAARNCSHLRLYKQHGFLLTAHFVGQKDFRSGARKAENREILASANLDLFDPDSEVIELDTDRTHIYCQLLHGGSIRPEHGTLAIPTRDQEGYVASCPIPIPEPERVQAEEIAEEMALEIVDRRDGAGEKAG